METAQDSYTCTNCDKEVEWTKAHICRSVESEIRPDSSISSSGSDKPDAQERIAVALESIAASLDGVLKYLATKST